MVYAREYGGRVLSFEPSGALKAGSLVMRDRESDSWWSIMTHLAIGGRMSGTRLRELAVSEKTTWGQWRAKHPSSRVLAVTHVARDAYAGYFASDRTFRNLAPEDQRLPAREGIFVFDLGGERVAVPHARLEGGRVLDLGEGRYALLHRSPGASMFESTRAWRLPIDLLDRGRDHPDRLAADLESRPGTAERIPGVDTFWYNFILQNPGARILP